MAEEAHSPPQPPLPEGLQHIAIIMDGNGRWAQRQGMDREQGHAAGAKAVNRIVRACRELGLKQLTLYAFSAQNWGRPTFEVDALMHLLLEYVQEERLEILDNHIRLTTIGDIESLPAWVRGPLQALCEESARNEGMTLALALSYGGREEILRAARQLAEAAQRGLLSPEAIEARHLTEALYTASMPDPDLVIRTGGEERLSNFLLWQSAYAELYFSEVAWPDFDRPHLSEAISTYARRQRRYGLTGAQVEADPGLEPIGASQ